MMVSVPYRGATFLNTVNGRMKMLIIVSVPYRGATFLNGHEGRVNIIGPRFRPLSGSYISQFLSQLGYKIGFSFPSPIGELHFSITCDMSNAHVGRSFRPLSGSYISQLSLDVAYATVCRTFPSPIGELHFSIMWGAYHK